MENVYRYDLINKIIKSNKFENYLEIGVCDPTECFDRVICKNKHSVDPGIEFPENPVDFKMTSDEFFFELERGRLGLSPSFHWDVIFIDGLHISTQVYKDILNSLYHLSPNGYILLHDCNPPSYFMQREDYYIDGQQSPWNGTVWKTIYYLRTHRDDLQVFTVDTDWGIGIIRKGKSIPIEFENKFYEYNQMSQNRTRDLGIIDIEQFNILTSQSF